ncbi:short-chain dehydrogenase [Pedobacter lusitanus]|uniref:Short-chain dehydrogenase n=1 Tax=Pedobacter lusitanus TaxID=1503925 RepID=A0A0D0GSM2_9SPHI|nr:oxidoreductase [Pedobacter lusitanus]KIO77436.1 short-chain dehydrogenase [Pedobacter lusitanus]
MSKQKIWFITGASRGFGFDITKAALAAGDKVIATVRKNPENLERAFQHSTNLLVTVLDVISEEQVKNAVERAVQHFGRIDVLVNNAGYGLLAATEEATDAEVRKQYDTNVFGLLNVTRAVLPQLRSQKSGHIINISSLFGYSASAAGFGLYGSTKYAVEGISEGLALELKPFGIHVTAVAPGLFSTDFVSADSYVSSAKILDAYAETVGVVRGVVGQLHGNQPGDPAKLADVIVQLAASENPPLHLPVGKDAVQLFKDSKARVSAEVEAWETISGSTDHIKN